MMFLCGLYRIESSHPVFVILTREASKDISHIHDRMPLILPQKAIRHWINHEVNPMGLLPFAITKLASEKEDESA